MSSLVYVHFSFFFLLLRLDHFNYSTFKFTDSSAYSNLLLSGYHVFFLSFQLYSFSSRISVVLFKILFIDILILSIHCFPVFLYLLNLFKTVGLKVLIRRCMSGFPRALFLFCFFLFFPLNEPYFLVSLYAF